MPSDHDSTGDRSFLFVSLRDDDIICRFDVSSGIPAKRTDYSVPGGPGPLVLSPRKDKIYAGLRKSNELACFCLDKNCDLIEENRTALPSDPCFLSTDSTGKYIFSSYYGAGQIAVHNSGLCELQRITSYPKAHSIRPDAGDKFVYSFHTEPNRICFYGFDPHEGLLKAKEPPCFSPKAFLCPRHSVFHPNQKLLYTANEKSSTISVYAFDSQTGLLSELETVSSLPGHAAVSNTAAEIRIAQNGKFLYISNRGHNSISCYLLDEGGIPRFSGSVQVPAVPRSFDISPDFKYLYVAGQESNELAAFEIDQASGNLSGVFKSFVGAFPMWVMAVSLP